MNVFCEEGDRVRIPDYKMQHIANHSNANYLNLIKNNDIVKQSNDVNDKDNDEEKEK